MFLLVLSFIMTLASLFIPVKIKDGYIDVGYPIHFAHEYVGYSFDITPMPEKTGIMNPWEDPTTFHRIRFLASWFIILIALETIPLAYMLYKSKTSKKRDVGQQRISGSAGAEHKSSLGGH